MKVLMLGWEFPPFIAGGLGTACYGLTRALNGLGIDVLFVLPRPIAAQTPEWPPPPAPVQPAARRNGKAHSAVPHIATAQPAQPTPPQRYQSQEFPHVTFQAVDSMLSPYLSEREYRKIVEQRAAAGQPTAGTASSAPALFGQPAPAYAPPPPPPTSVLSSPGPQYAGDLLEETRRYADLAVSVAGDEEFDVVHAHDWMTFRAGMAVAQLKNRPLVVHIHSTEYDRSGQALNPQIVEIERAGMLAATKVIAVSHLTRRMLIARYGIPQEKIEVIHNAIDVPADHPAAAAPSIERNDKLVLFLGRVTGQKGPEYFLAAAQKVLDLYQDVKFVIAGSGDMMRSMIELAAAMGIGHKVLFTGFLQNRDVERIFQMADLYVMPSVSEPFGIAPLEAMAQDVPVIVSKQSGVAEVIQHALKVDFWDTDDLANKILAVLRHPPLGRTLRKHAAVEVRRMSWRDVAEKVIDLYRHVAPARPARLEPALAARGPAAATRSIARQTTTVPAALAVAEPPAESAPVRTAPRARRAAGKPAAAKRPAPKPAAPAPARPASAKPAPSRAPAAPKAKAAKPKPTTPAKPAKPAAPKKPAAAKAPAPKPAAKKPAGKSGAASAPRGKKPRPPKT